jgi:hypothetical protein
MPGKGEATDPDPRAGLDAFKGKRDIKAFFKKQKEAREKQKKEKEEMEKKRKAALKKVKLTKTK